MNYRIVDNAEEMKLEDIVRLLRMTYWADKRPKKPLRNPCAVLTASASIPTPRTSSSALPGSSPTMPPRTICAT